jgi:hypothetical protein
MRDILKRFEGRDIVGGLPEKFDAAPANVLVDLQPHTAGSAGTGITHSREASAP